MTIGNRLSRTLIGMVVSLTFFSYQYRFTFDYLPVVESSTLVFCFVAVVVVRAAIMCSIAIDYRLTERLPAKARYSAPYVSLLVFTPHNTAISPTVFRRGWYLSPFYKTLTPVVSWQTSPVLFPDHTVELLTLSDLTRITSLFLMVVLPLPRTVFKFIPTSPHICPFVYVSPTVLSSFLSALVIGLCCLFPFSFLTQ